LSNLHKIGKYGKEIGEKSGKLSTKLGKNLELSHSIGTSSVPDNITRSNYKKRQIAQIGHVDLIPV